MIKARSTQLLDVRSESDSGSAAAGGHASCSGRVRRCEPLVFEKASTRARLSLEIAASEPGGHPVVPTSSGSQMGRGEPLRDTARVLSRMVHAITFRTADESRFREMAEYSIVPVLNALTDQSHPMQLCADLMTVRERFGRLQGLTYSLAGRRQVTWRSPGSRLAGILGLSLRLACPEGYRSGAQLGASCIEYVAGRSRSCVILGRRPAAGASCRLHGRLRQHGGREERVRVACKPWLRTV